nr:MAG TPA: hypothetical protein [Caudoviricetes sp.]
MNSIQVQNRTIIYIKPNLQKVYVRDNNKKHEVRAIIDNNDCLLGTYTTMKQSLEVLESVVKGSIDVFRINSFGEYAYNELIYRVPEDEGEYK